RFLRSVTTIKIQVHLALPRCRKYRYTNVVKFPLHFHTRRRKEPYPSKRFLMRMLDIMVYVVGVVGPLATLPQLIEIYSTHNASGVSLTTWGLYAITDIPWVIYAFVHREPP